MRLLIIEDDPFFSKWLRLNLSDRNYAIEQAEDLAQAIDQLERNCFDVIILDLGLPDSSGIPTLDAMLDRAGETPIVVLTGSAGAEDAMEGIRHGAQDFIAKSATTPDQLKRALDFAALRAQIPARAAVRKMSTEFAGILRHNFQTPLIGAKAALGLLREHFTEAERRNWTDLVDVLIQTNDGVLSNLRMTVACYEAHNKSRSRIALSPMVKALIADNGSQVSIKMDCAPSANVEGDPDSVRFMVARLLANVVSNTVPGGEVVVSVYDRSHWFHIAIVRETNERPHAIASTFDRSLELDTILAKRIAADHGGKVRELIDGSGFIICLPGYRSQAS